MQSNVVKTILVAKDDASKIIAGLQGNVAGAAKGFNVLGALGTAALGGIVVATGAAIAGAVGLTRAFSEANEISLSALKSANNLSAELGSISLTKAEEYVESLNKKLTMAAAVLPGTTKEYIALSNVISNDVARAFQNPDGTLNVKGWEKATTDITSLLKFVGDGADQQKVLLASQKLLAGNATLNELRQYDFLGSNVAFMRGLEKAESDLGKEWKQFTQEERVKTLEGLKGVLLSDEMIDRLSKTVGGLSEFFKTKFFDPSVGLFGIMRELDSNGGSVYKSLTETVGLFIGKSGIITTMLDSLTALNIDPMVTLKFQIDRFNTFLSRLTNYLDIFRDSEGLLNVDRLKADVKDRLGDFTSGILNQINGLVTGFAGNSTGLLNRMISGANSLDWGAVGSKVGEILAFIVEMSLNGAIAVVTTVNWGGMLALLPKIGNAVLQGIVSFLTNLDPSVYLAAGLALVGAAAVAILVPAGIAAITGFVTTVFGGLAFAAAIALAGISTPVLLAVGGVGLLVVGFLKLFGVSFGEAWGFVVNSVTGMLTSIVSLMRGSWNLVTSAVNLVINGIVGLWRQIGSLIDRIPGINVPNGMKAGNAAGGFLPDAFRREMQAMPAGASPIIANSSELILNRDQQRSLLSGGGSSVSLGGINIYAQQGQDPAAIADMVIRQIENRLTRRYAV